MAAQWITVVRLAGSAAERVLERLNRWDAARKVDGEDDALVDPVQWPRDDRDEADEFAAKLAENAGKPPVLFYCRSVDLWSMGDVYLDLMDQTPLCIHTKSLELYGVDLSSKQHLSKACDAQLRQDDLLQEYRWYALIMREALTAWEGVANDGVLLIIREVLDGLVEDHEVEKSLTALPKWLRAE